MNDRARQQASDELCPGALELAQALERQTDNIAFILNHVGLPEQWFNKFTAELEQDRKLLKPTSAPQCCMCGKKGLSTVEGDGGTECELTDGRWVCSAECWDRAVEPELKP